MNALNEHFLQATMNTNALLRNMGTILNFYNHEFIFKSNYTNNKDKRLWKLDKNNALIRQIYNVKRK